MAVSAWFTSSWRSRATRRRSSSWARRTSLPARCALLVHALEQALEGLGEALDLLGRVPGELERGGLGRVDPLDPADQVLERPEAPLQHPDVHAEREEDHQREHDELPALVAHGQVEARHDARGEQRQRDQHDVGGDHLADQGVAALSQSGGSSSQMGSAPHIGTSGACTRMCVEAFTRGLPQQGLGFADGAPAGAPRLLSAGAILSEAMASGAEILRRAKEQIREVDPKEVHELLDHRNGEVIVDVREQHEFEEAHIRAPCTCRAATSSRASRAPPRTGRSA